MHRVQRLLKETPGSWSVTTSGQVDNRTKPYGILNRVKKPLGVGRGVGVEERVG